MTIASASLQKWMKWGGILLVLGLPWIFLLQPNSNYRCGTCGSWRSQSQFRLGPSRAWSIPLSPVMKGVWPSDASEALLGPGHTHQWTYSQGSDGYVFIRWGTICALGGSARVNPFVREWEKGLAFQVFVDGERSAGRLTREDVLAIAELPRWPTFEQRKDARVVRALARAHQLLKESGEKDVDWEWSSWSLPESEPVGCPGPGK